MSPAPLSLDQALANIKAGGIQDATETDKLIALKRMEIESEDRRADRAEKERTRAEERAGKSDLWKTLATVLGPVVIGMLNKPAIDPALIAIIGGKNSSEEMKQFLEMQRQQSAIQMETLTKSMLHIMEVKDSMNEKMMERAVEAAESGDNDSGIVGVLKQVANIAGPLMAQGRENQAQALPAPPANATANQPAQAKTPPPPPALVVLKTLRNIYTNDMTPKQLRTAKASLVVVILQDDQLVEALLTEDENALITYCTPIVMADKMLAEWIRVPANDTKKAAAEWLVDFVKDELIPRVDYEINGDSDDNEKQDELNASNTSNV